MNAKRKARPTYSRDLMQNLVTCKIGEVKRPAFHSNSPCVKRIEVRK